MTEPKFTKGPWHSECGDGPENPYARSDLGVWSEVLLDAAINDPSIDDGDEMDESWICGIWGKIGPEEIANARLIAAAPELYEALTLAADALSDLLSGDCESPRGYHLEAMNAADAALAKARGEQ